MTWQGERWKDRPFRAWLIRVAVFVVPIVAGIAAATITARLLPAANGFAQTVAWWALVLGASFVAMWIIDRLARKLLPLAALMRMSLVFPNKAPSRFGVTLKSYSSKRIQADVEKARAEGIDDDPTRAAEYVLTLIASMGHHDRLTRGHAERTRAYTDLLAEELGLPQEDQDRLRWGALLHDIGKLGVPAEILNSDTGLTEEDWEAVRHHPRDGFELTRPIHAFLGPWALTILHHHERYDGTGYPLGLSGDNISYGARIVAVGDAYDAMTAFRTYQAPLSPAIAKAELADGAGTQFDPAVVRAFLALSMRPLRRIAGPLVLLGQLPFVTGLQRLGDAATAALATAATLSVVVVSGIVPGPGSQAPSDAPVAQPDEVIVAAAGDSTSDPAGGTRSSSQEPPPPPTTTTSTTSTTTTVPTTTTVAPPPPAPRRTTAPPPPPPATTTTTLAPWLPTAVDDELTVNEDTSGIVDVLANDSDNDGDLDSTSLTIASGPLNGSATVVTAATAADGAPGVQYVPEPNAHGTDSFDYEVCDLGGRCSTATVMVSVMPVNDPPVAIDDNATTNEDTPVTIEVLANDIDVDADLDADSLRVTVGPTTGDASVAGASVIYDPDEDVSGSDTFTYAVCDLTGLCSTATATLSITPVNDGPTAVDDAVSTDEDTPVTITVLDNDTDIDDGLDVTSLVVLSGPSIGTTSVAGAAITYVPDPNANGNDTFTYRVCDVAGLCSSASVAVTISPINDAPSPVGDEATTAEDTPVTIAVLVNDTDVDDGVDPTSLAVDTTPSSGTATVVGTDILYEPAADFSGSDAFDYLVCDFAGECSTARVTVTITPVNDAPTAVDDVVDNALRSVLTIDVLANDSDIDGGPLTISSSDSSSALGGSVVCTTDCAYTPPDPWTGPDTFSYIVSDGRGGVDTARVTITPLFPELELYLRAAGPGDQVSVPVLPLSLERGPTNTVLPNYDTNRDPDPGLLLGQIAAGPGQQIASSDPTRYQLWMYPVTTDLVISGSASLNIWAATEDMQAGLEARLRTYILDCPITSVDGSDCVEIAPRMFVDRDPWSFVDGQWEPARWNYGTINRTIAAGRAFAVKLTIAGVHTDDDMRFAFDAAGLESSFVVDSP